MRRWPTPMRPARPACLAPSFAAIAAPSWRRSTRTSNRSPARSPARCWPPCRPSGRTSPSSTRRRPTAKGNVLVEGIIGVQKEAVLAARRAVVTVEEVVDDFDDAASQPDRAAALDDRRHRGRARRRASFLHAWLLYQRDNAAYLEWDEIAADRDRFLAWMQKNVLIESTADDFAVRVERLRTAA